MKVIFLIGSPRSGTTILENILGCHPDIAEFYEPYYLWERFFNADKDDVWDGSLLTKTVARDIRREFARFAGKSRKALILDKSPIHAFNIPIIHSIFPEAFWIHLLRDGRDVTLSIRKEWEKRKKIVREKDLVAFLKTTKSMLDRQPFWRYKLMAITYEFKNSFPLTPHRFLNKSRWKGEAGWGPRFSGWEEYLAAHTSLEFNAMQWVKSVEAVRADWNRLPPASKRLELRYEELLADPEKSLASILSFLGYPADADFFTTIPRLKSDNTGKWRVEFSGGEIEMIRPVLTPLLEKTGYLKSSPWVVD